MKQLAPTLLISALLLTVLPATADVLLFETIEGAPANRAEGVPRPKSGQGMDTVQKRYGDPIQKKPWVGDPPITRWVYNQYTVYFEHNKVITSVVHR